MLVPFIFSVLGVVLVCFAVYKIHQKYDEDVESAKIKYDIRDTEL
jgi:uncharacterized membrane protein